VISIQTLSSWSEAKDLLLLLLLLLLLPLLLPLFVLRRHSERSEEPCISLLSLHSTVPPKNSHFANPNGTKKLGICNPQFRLLEAGL
jgi:hypothetical protein